jgi:hypothetical protein
MEFMQRLAALVPRPGVPLDIGIWNAFKCHLRRFDVQLAGADGKSNKCG